VTESTDLVAVEQPQQLITIEPTKYVALVFENHRTRADAYKAEAPTVTYDITTTAGMKTAVEWRAKGRDIRVEVTDIHKERKAPILEIGRLMDARKKEIIADVEPDEDRFDRDIKAETARKEAEKAAKLAAEKARIDAIRAKIEEIKDCVVVAMGRSSDEIESAIAELESTQITLEDWMEFAGEAQAAQVATVEKLKGMLDAQIRHEIEQQRLAAERAQLAKEREEAAERERQAAAERQRIADEERIARAKAQAAMLAEQQAHEARLRAEREAAEAELRKQREAEEARLAEQRAELARQQAAIDAANAERERVEREAREAAEAAARLEADHAEGIEENARIDAERAAAFEAQQQEAQQRAEEAERIRREHTQFLVNGPGDSEIIEVLAAHYDVGHTFVVDWLAKFDAASFLTPFSGEKAA
jgi:chromosome segregation ATPase